MTLGTVLPTADFMRACPGVRSSSNALGNLQDVRKAPNPTVGLPCCRRQRPDVLGDLYSIGAWQGLGFRISGLWSDNLANGEGKLQATFASISEAPCCHGDVVLA